MGKAMGNAPQRPWHRRGLSLGFATGVALALLAAPALASHHLIRIREVFAGSSTLTTTEYVELQMYSSGQNQFASNGATVRLYDAGGTEVVTKALNSNPANAQSQRRVLVGSPGVQTNFGVSPDFSLPNADSISDAGGAACFTSTTFGGIDCVSWGSFSGSLPSPTGGDVSPGGIGNGSAIRRSIAPGCPSLLEGTDDTNDPADWSEVTPDPLNNASTPPEKPCPDTIIDSGPSGSTTDRTPTFKFHSPGNASATFKCRLDGGAYTSCASPDTLDRLALGRHTFQVRAILNGAKDPTPAKRSFKVVA